MKFSAYEVNTVLFARHIFNTKGSFDFSHMVFHYNIPVSVTLRLEPMVQKVVYANRGLKFMLGFECFGIKPSCYG